MNNSEKSKTIAYFTNLVNKHQDSPKALNWGSTYSQEKRFEVLTEINIEDGATLLDVGCGLGDLYKWLNKKGTRIKYTGIDITPTMIEKARANNGDAEFRLADICNPDINIGRYDYVLASGIFYLLEDKPEVTMKNIIERLYDISLKGIAFNSLSSWSNIKQGNEFYADPLKTLEFCRTLSPFVTMRHDYHPADFTIYLRKNKIN